MHLEFFLLKWESFASGEVACIVRNIPESKNQGHLPLDLGPYASFFQKQNKKFRIEAEGIKSARISSKSKDRGHPRPLQRDLQVQLHIKVSSEGRSSSFLPSWPCNVRRIFLVLKLS